MGDWPWIGVSPFQPEPPGRLCGRCKAVSCHFEGSSNLLCTWQYLEVRKEQQSRKRHLPSFLPYMTGPQTDEWKYVIATSFWRLTAWCMEKGSKMLLSNGWVFNLTTLMHIFNRSDLVNTHLWIIIASIYWAFTNLNGSCWFLSFFSLTTLWGRCYYNSHFTDEKT